MKAKLMIIFTILFHVAIAQDAGTRELLEKAAETFEVPASDPVLLEELTDRLLNPIDVNRSTMQELEAIPFLTPDQLFNLQDYILKYGEILSIHELKAIEGFDSVLIMRIEPFILIRPLVRTQKITPRSLLQDGRQELLLRFGRAFPDAAGYRTPDSTSTNGSTKSYPGNPGSFYFRYAYSWFNRVQAGIAGEKDPGEQLFSGAQRQGMDHYSGYLAIGNFGILENLIVGNFRAGFGQGLTFAPGISVSGAPGFNQATTPASGVRPSLGMNETNYLRGFAASLKIRNAGLSLFISQHPRDATTQAGADSLSDKTFSSFYGSGYHRTAGEVGKRDAVRELITGGNIFLTFARDQRFGLKIGMTGVYTRYSIPMVKPDDLYKLFSFYGKENMVIGFDYQLRISKALFSGELSRSANGGLAGIGGLAFSPDPRLSATIIYRYYAPDYQNLNSAAFGQFSQNVNESGIFIALNSALDSKITLSAYADLFRAPWLRYRIDAPSSGEEFGLMANYLPVRSVTLKARFTGKISQLNSAKSDQDHVNKLNAVKAFSYRFNMVWMPKNGIVLVSGIDVKSYSHELQTKNIGFIVSEELQVKGGRFLETFTFKLSYFDVPGYDTRIYQYEPEVLYGYSVPAYEGDGGRVISVTKFSISRFLNIWLRAGITWYNDRQNIGNGPDMTAGNLRGEVTGQLMIKW